MTVSLKWDNDPPKTGLPNSGTDTKVYPPGSTAGMVVATNEQDPTKTETVNFALPLTPTGAAITPDKTTVDSTGDATARTITVAGTGFPASITGTVTLNTGAPASGGTVVVTANINTNAAGAFTGAVLLVPANQPAGPFHLLATVGAVTSDITAITVTGGAQVPTITPDKTTVDSNGDVTARTVTVTGVNFAVSGTGTVAIHPGAPGAGGTAVASSPVTTDAAGAFPATTVVVPVGQSAGDYHIVATVGATTSDNTALAVTGGATATLTPDKTTVESNGDAVARTVTVTGAGLPVSTAGHIGINTGAPGSGGTEVIGANVTSDAAGAIVATPLIVPAAQAAGAYHLLGTFGATTVDATAITITATPVMTAPTNVAAGTTTATTVPLTWDAVTAPVTADGYIVRWAPTGTTTWTERPVVTAAADTITGLTASTGYDIQVKSQAAGHLDSAWSTTITATTAA